MRISLTAITVVLLLLATASTMAQVATPTVLSPASCRVEPRTIGEVKQILATGFPRPEVPIDEVPQGEPADAETVAAISAVEQEFAACLNANDWPRWFALLTEDEIRSAVLQEEVANLFATAGTVEAGDVGEQDQIASVAVTDVRRLADGRARAIVEWRGAPQDLGAEGFTPYESNLHLYKLVDGRWLRDEEVSDFCGASCGGRRTGLTADWHPWIVASTSSSADFGHRGRRRSRRTDRPRCLPSAASRQRRALAPSS